MDARDEQSQQTADYAMALDLCSQLTRVLDEPQVLHRILEIFVTLFAPRKAVFWVMENGWLVQALTYPASTPSPPCRIPVGYCRKQPPRDFA